MSNPPTQLQLLIAGHAMDSYVDSVGGFRKAMEDAYRLGKLEGLQDVRSIASRMRNFCDEANAAPGKMYTDDFLLAIDYEIGKLKPAQSEGEE